MKKAQGLPLSTIVLVIIVIVVLAAVVIFFIIYFGKGTAGVDIFQCQQLCQAEKTRFVDNSYTWPTDVTTNSEYCKQGCGDVTGPCNYNSTYGFTCA